MFGLTPAHLVIILVILLVVIGPGKLPEVGGAIGKSIREFQKAAGQNTEPTHAAAPTQPVQPMAPQLFAPMQPVQVYYSAQPGQSPTHSGQPPSVETAYSAQLPQFGAPLCSAQADAVSVEGAEIARLAPHPEVSPADLQVTGRTIF
jgi:TatA/E family protein of Tat protein translocase